MLCMHYIVVSVLGRAQMDDATKKPPSFTSRYIISAILIRLVVRMFLANAGDGVQGYAIPILGAFVVAYMWPFVLERRAYEREDYEPKETDSKMEDLK